MYKCLVLECCCVSPFCVNVCVYFCYFFSLCDACWCLCVGSCVVNVLVCPYPLCCVEVRRPMCVFPLSISVSCVRHNKGQRSQRNLCVVPAWHYRMYWLPIFIWLFSILLFAINVKMLHGEFKRFWAALHISEVEQCLTSPLKFNG